MAAPTEPLPVRCGSQVLPPEELLVSAPIRRDNSITLSLSLLRQNTFTALVDDRVPVICKVARPHWASTLRMDVSPYDERAIRRERAAFVLARLLGWDDLVPLTVLRRLTWMQDRLAAVSIFELRAIEGVPLECFAEEDLTRAAVFDFLIRQLDRGAHNWLGVLSADRPATGISLRLIDHQHAFTEVSPWPMTVFVQSQAEWPIDNDCADRLRRAARCAYGSELTSLIGFSAVVALANRANRLADERHLST